MRKVSVQGQDVVRVTREASLTGLSGVLVSGKTSRRHSRRGHGSADVFHTVLRPTIAYFRQDGMVTIRSHSQPGYTVTVSDLKTLVGWYDDGEPVEVDLKR